MGLCFITLCVFYFFFYATAITRDIQKKKKKKKATRLLKMKKATMKKATRQLKMVLQTTSTSKRRKTVNDRSSKAVDADKLLMAQTEGNTALLTNCAHPLIAYRNIWIQYC